MHDKLYKATEELGMAVNAVENAVVPNQGHNAVLHSNHCRWIWVEI